MPEPNVRVIVRGGQGVAIARDYHAPCAVTCLSSAHAATHDFRTRFADEPTAVLITKRKSNTRADVPAQLAPGDVNILNLCGKISHTPNVDSAIFDPGCVPMLTRVHDGFGVRVSAATIYGNFVTSPHATTTLFRGCKRCSDVQSAMTLLFRGDVVREVVIHMLVAMAVLPHAVVMSAQQIARALHEHPAWTAETPPSLDDNVYMHPVQLTCGDKRVLVHVYATGAVFFFVTCTQKTLMRPDSELDFVRLCREIYACVERVC
jgi:hypothetical protein